MKLLADVRALARFACGLRGFLRWSITPRQAHAIVRERIARRSESFLEVVRHGIFGNPRSPRAGGAGA